MAGIQDNQVLNTAGDAPVAVFVGFALIAGVEPAVLQGFGGFGGALPVSGENIWAADQDFAVVGAFHFYAGDCGADKTWLDVGGIVSGADGRGFGEAVHLQDGDAEHHEEKLSINCERSRAADEGFQIGADAFADCREHQRTAEGEPERVAELGLFIVAADEGLLGAGENCCRQAAAFLHGGLNSGADAFEERGDVQEIFRGG